MQTKIPSSHELNVKIIEENSLSLIKKTKEIQDFLQNNNLIDIEETKLEILTSFISNINKNFSNMPNLSEISSNVYINKEFPYINLIAAYEKQPIQNYINIEAWGNIKVGKYILLTAMGKKHMVETIIYKLNDSENEIISSAVLSQYHENEEYTSYYIQKDIHEISQENEALIILNYIASFYQKQNIEWTPTINTPVLELIVHQEYQQIIFKYIKNNKVSSIKFNYENEVSNIVSIVS